MTDQNAARPRAFSQAHMVVLAICALLLIAVVFGIADGIVTPAMLRQPMPSPTDPITLP